MSTIVDLDAEYRRTRAALVNAGVDMTDSMDALYRDWRRWRDRSKSPVAVGRVAVVDADQWWARHLAQFRRLIDPLHVAARAERARKDESAVRARLHPGEKQPAAPRSKQHTGVKEAGLPRDVLGPAGSVVPEFLR